MQKLEAVSDATPDTEFSFAHGLDRTPRGFLIINQDKAGSFYAGTTAWDDTDIYLKCSAATVAFTVLVF
jgi:hypothetical protein